MAIPRPHCAAAIDGSRCERLPTSVIFVHVNLAYHLSLHPVHSKPLSRPDLEVVQLNLFTNRLEERFVQQVLVRIVLRL